MSQEGGEDPLLFTPGPLTTSATVKRAMLHDAGSRDVRFIETVRNIRERLLGLGGVSRELGYEAILMQGSGTYGLESVVSSVVAPDGKLLVLINGAYGRRMSQIAQRLGIETVEATWAENEPIDVGRVEGLLKEGGITHVAVVHCETTTGILNPVESIGKVVRAAGATYVVDAMSSFGAIELDLADASVDYLISSANKCIEGVPGFSFILARRENLVATRGRARSISLDLLAQWEGLEKNGQFRFTPPTHALLAFEQALDELDAEGGVAGRGERYRANHEVLMRGMTELGFEAYLDSRHQSYIITAFRYPTAGSFSFGQFYEQLAERGLLIYPGKLTDVDCFRIGSIGRMGRDEMERLISAIGEIVG